jgi:hypothetical protein
MQQDTLAAALKLIFQGIELLQNNCFHNRKYTIDGRLVGDIGEIVAAREFDIILDTRSRKTHDARTRDGRDVQIKATFKESLTLTSIPVLYLGLKLKPNGSHEIVFNGPGRLIAQAFAHRKGLGEKQLSFSVAALRRLSETVENHEQVPRAKKTG